MDCQEFITPRKLTIEKNTISELHYFLSEDTKSSETKIILNNW